MKYTTEESLREFNAWSGARDTLNRLIELDKCDEVESFIKECMPNATQTEINDFLWFEDEYIAVDILGYDSVDDFYNEREDI